MSMPSTTSTYSFGINGSHGANDEMCDSGQTYRVHVQEGKNLTTPGVVTRMHEIHRETGCDPRGPELVKMVGTRISENKATNKCVRGKCRTAR